MYRRTLTEAIHFYRLRHSRDMLIDTSESIEAIVVRCGFLNAIYCRRLFKRDQGMSPRAYRRLYARMSVNTV
jgi:transcriptional regulator GlxA family with amidase domain